MQTNNLLLGVMPESVGIFVFGLILVAFAVFLRRLFGKRDAIIESELEKTVS